MSALPNANLPVVPHSVTYILPPKNGYPGGGWVYPRAAMYPRPIREFYPPVGSMGTYAAPPPSAGAVLMRPSGKLDGAIRHLGQRIPLSGSAVSVGQRLPHPLAVVSTGTLVSHAVTPISAGQRVAHPSTTISAGQRFSPPVSVGQRLSHTVAIVSSGQHVARPVISVSAGHRMSRPETTVSSGQRLSRPVSDVSVGQRVSRPTTSVSVGQRAADPETSISVGQRVAHPGTSVSVGQRVTHPGTSISGGQRVVHPGTSVSVGQRVAHPGTSVSVGQRVTHPGTSVSGGQRVVHPGTSVSVVQQVVHPVSSVPVGQRATHPSSALSMGPVTSRPATGVSVGSRVSHPVTSVSTAQRVAYPTTPVSAGQRMAHPVTSVSASQQKAHPAASGECPKIAELCTGASSDSPVDLSLRPAKNVSKTPQKQITEQSSPSRSYRKPYPKMCPKNTIPIRPLSQPRSELKKTTYLLCRYCPFKAITRDQIQSHILEAHPQRVVVVPKTFTCNYCPYVTSSELCMVRHLLTLHRSKILPPRSDNNGVNNLFSCSVCVFSADESTMINHMLDHYKDSTPCNNCTSCVKQVHSSPPRKRKAGAVQKSVDVSLNRKPRDGDKFGAPQSNVSSLAIELLECSICHSKFLNKASLYAHQLSHSLTANHSDASTATTPKTLNSASKKGSYPVATTASNIDGSTAKLVTSQPVASPSTTTTISMGVDPKETSMLDNAEQQQMETVVSPTSTVNTAVQSDDLSSAKKRKLAMKIYRNSSGVYESERSDTPTTVLGENPPNSASTSPMKLCVQVPLQVLAGQKYVPTTSADKPEDEVQSPTRLQIPLDILPKRKLLSAKAAKSTPTIPVPAPSQESAPEAYKSDKVTMPTVLHAPEVTESSNNSQTVSASGNCNRMEMNLEVPEKFEDSGEVVIQNVENQEKHRSHQSGEVRDAYSEIKPCKVMANMLKKKLSNIHLKTRHVDLSCNGSDESISGKGQGKNQQCNSNLKVANGSVAGLASPAVLSHKATLKDGDFIDLTLEDTSDEECTVTATQMVSSERKSETETTNLAVNLQLERVHSDTSKELISSDKLKISQEDKASVEFPSVDTAATTNKHICGTSNSDLTETKERSTEIVDGAEIGTKMADITEPKLKVAAVEATVGSTADADVTKREGQTSAVTTDEISAKQLLETHTSKPEVTDCELPIAESSANSMECEPAKTDTENGTSGEQATGRETGPNNKSEVGIADTNNCKTTETEHVKLETEKIESNGLANGVVDSPSSELGAAEGNAPGSVPLFHPKLVRRPKNVRRNGGRLPSMAGTSNINTLSSEDLVICPFCPKRVLFRLLPAHVQFHGSDCEHRCRDCNFASSFKWALETHLPCHKDMAPDDARQITELEWKMMKDGSISDDEEVEMTQRLLIREEPSPVPVVLPCKRQIARKSTVKKSLSLPTGPYKKAAFPTVPVTPTESPAPLPVNKTKARSMEDFFAQILTDRVKHK